MGKFSQSSSNTSVFWLQDNNLSKSQRIFTIFFFFLGHLSRSDKVSFCDYILSVHPASVHACVRKQFLQTIYSP